MSDPMWTDEELEHWQKLNTPYREGLRPKYHIVLNALEKGLTVPMDGMQIRMALDDFEGADRDDLGYVTTTEKDGKKCELFWQLDITVGQFKEMCARLPAEAIGVVAMNSAMRGIQLEKVRKRDDALKERAKHKPRR